MKPLLNPIRQSIRPHLRLGGVLGALLGALLLPSAFAAPVLTPAAPLLRHDQLLRQAQPDVVLSRRPAGQTVQIVTPGTTTPKYLARKYGVTLGAVRTVHQQKGLRVMEVRWTQPERRAPRRPESVVTYRVRAGDTLAGIAARFGLRVVDVLGTNLDRRSLDHLRAGETLRLPTRERGLLLTIKPGQTAMSLIAGYKADLVATAQANGRLPTELHVGDELLLPGIQAQTFQKQLLARRAAEQRARVAYEKQQRYERYLAWRADRERQRLEERYKTQEQYEKYLAWRDSPERQRQIQAVQRQAAYEAAQARAREQARLAAQRASAAAASARQAATRQAAVRQAASTSSQAAGGTGLSWPMRSFRLTSRYGERDIAYHRQMFHGGIDLAAPYGTPIYAAASGVVSQSGYGSYGLNVYTTSGNLTLVYGHMSRTAVYAGQTVARGQLIGYVGCTGICTGPHLHFEVRVGGQAINPLSMLP